MYLSGATRSINRDLERQARTLAGWKGYITNLPNLDPEAFISAYHRLHNIEESFAHVQVRPENSLHLPHPWEVLEPLAGPALLVVVGLLHRLARLSLLAEEDLVGVVALNGSRVRTELGLPLLLPLAHDKRDGSTDNGRREYSRKQPYPGGMELLPPAPS